MIRQRRTLFLVMIMLCLAGSTVRAAAQERPAVTVWKSPWCGCCANWINHMEQSGYRVEVHELENLDSVKMSAGIPEALQSCHTAIVGGYLIEGHVPAADIDRLLAENPAVQGLAVPGMPSGSPGMENGQQEAYDVVTFTQQGETKVFNSYK